MRRVPRLVFIIVLAIVIVTAGYVLLTRENSSDTSGKSSIAQLIPLGSPNSTPFEFQEMTIPYLRGQSYKSFLGPLQKYRDHPSYTSYTTSFNSEGLRVNGLLTIPKDSVQKHPAIVFIHGYIAPTIYKTTERYVEYIDYLARNGFVVFKIDLRGNGDSEGEPGGAYYSGDYVVDTLNAYAALQAADFVDSTHIGLWGHSMAGNVVMRAFAAKPDIPAVAIWAGAGYTYTDLQEYRIDDRSYRPPMTDSEVVRKRQRLMDTYGPFQKDHPFWKQVAVTDYLKDLKGALEIHHAVDDTVVNVEYSRNLMKLLDGATIPHTLFEYPSGGHNLTGSSFSSAMQRTVDFYKKYL